MSGEDAGEHLSEIEDNVVPGQLLVVGGENERESFYSDDQRPSSSSSSTPYSPAANVTPFAATHQTNNENASDRDLVVVDQKMESEDVEGESYENHLKSYRVGMKHVFVLSSAGKPIYSRYGAEENFVAEMATVQVLLSTVISNWKSSNQHSSHQNDRRRSSASTDGNRKKSTDDSLHSEDEDYDELIEFEYFPGWKFVFLDQSPIILVAISRTCESSNQLRRQLSLIYYQILSVLTWSQVKGIFERRENYDLRRLLHGTDTSLKEVLDRWEYDCSMPLEAVTPLPIPSSIRDTIAQSLVYSLHKNKKVIFGLVMAEGRLVCSVSMRQFQLHPDDLQILFTLLSINKASFRNAQSQWLPICLPHFDNSGFLHAHISYLGEASPFSLILLSTEREAFDDLQEGRNRMLDKLSKSKSLNYFKMKNMEPPGVRLSQVVGSDMWHFIYKNRNSHQVCMGSWEPPYVNRVERDRLIQKYLQIMDKMGLHSNLPSSSSTIANTDSNNLLRIYFTNTGKEAFIAWVTTNFELYAAFTPLVTKQSAIAKIEKLMKWLKKEEGHLFILNVLYF